jgi:diguanylate cyclase (GGDEF)-like protein
LAAQGLASEIYLSIKSKTGTEIPMLINAVRKERQHQNANDCTLMVIQQRNEYEDQILSLKRAAEMAVRQKDKINQELIEAHKRLEYKRGKLQEALTLVEKLATTDALTQLKNRRAFEEALNHEIAKAQRSHNPVSLIIVDADHFKYINDTFGHPVGDSYLQQLAHILGNNVRKTDLVARYGGEEFVLVLPNTEATNALHFAEKLRAAIESAEWSERPLTASMGVATLSESITNSALLLKWADEALYASKNNGRNRVTHANQLEVIY